MPMTLEFLTVFNFPVDSLHMTRYFSPIIGMVEVP